MNQDKIGNIIKQIRKDHNLTQADFADKFGVTYQAVSKWENGKNIPDISILKEICQEYNIDINTLLDNKIKPKKRIILPIAIILIVLTLVGGIYYLKNKDSFEMKKVKTSHPDFKVSGSVAYNNKGNMYIYISDIEYDNKEDSNEYKELKATLYEEDNGKNIVVKTAETIGKEKTIKDYLKDVSFNIDDYKSSCNDLSKSKFYIEIEAIDKSDKQTFYKVPLELEELCPEK